MEELMINLFSLIADQIQNKQELFDEEGKIMQALLNSGYPAHEADAALMLMQTLVQKQSEGFFTSTRSSASPVVRMRMMNKEERDRISVDAFSFLSKLAHLDIISEDQREELLEKALTTCHGHIDLDHIKALVTFTLFIHSQEHDGDSFPGFRRVKGTAWN